MKELLITDSASQPYRVLADTFKHSVTFEIDGNEERQSFCLNHASAQTVIWYIPSPSSPQYQCLFVAKLVVALLNYNI